MLKFITFAVKVQLNVHDLNNEAVAGNVTDIRVMDYLIQNEKGEWEKTEAPAVSGRMLKHWHYEAMRKLGIEQKLPFCDACKIGEPVRPAILDGKVLSHRKAIELGTEEVIKKCVLCDTHGYLAAIAGKGKKRSVSEGESEGQEGISERRSSRVMFSWLMPIISIPSKQVIHSRVKSGKEFKEKDEGVISQMPFNKSYASGIYSFVSGLDVDRIGLIELNLGDNNPYAVDDNNGRKDRIKLAIEAYRYLISGQMGASLSHAIPHWDPIEIFVCYSEIGPLPFPVSPIYSNYISKTLGIMPKGSVFLYWGKKKQQGVIVKEKIDEIFEELTNRV